jgi:hypothetical protein
MFVPRLNALCLSALVLFCQAHCALHHGECEVAQARLMQSEAVPPLEADPHSSENDSGCICHGTLVELPVAAPAPEQAGFRAALELLSSGFRSWLAPPLLQGHLARDCVSAPPPISGRMLRALISSLII